MVMPIAKKKVVIRSKTRHAHSKAGYLKALTWQAGEGPWRVEIMYLDN